MRQIPSLPSYFSLKKDKKIKSCIWLPRHALLMRYLYPDTAYVASEKQNVGRRIESEAKNCGFILSRSRHMNKLGELMPLS